MPKAVSLDVVGPVVVVAKVEGVPTDVIVVDCGAGANLETGLRLPREEFLAVLWVDVVPVGRVVLVVHADTRRWIVDSNVQIVELPALISSRHISGRYARRALGWA